MAGRIDPLVKEKLDGISSRIDTLDNSNKQEIGKLKSDLGSLEKKAAKVEDLNAVAEKAVALDTKVNGLGVALKDYDTRLKEADSRMVKLGEKAENTNSKLGSIETRVSSLEQVKAVKIEDVDLLTTRLSNLEARLDTLGERERRITQLETEVSRLQGNLNQVTRERDDLASGRPSIDFSSLANNLKSSLQQLNEQARLEVKAGKPQFVVDGLEMEVKGNIDLKTGQLRVAQLMPHETSDQSVSTLRFSLKPLPVMKIVEDE